MAAVFPILLIALAGLLLGGAVSMHRQGASRGLIGALAVLSALAAAGGVFWLLPGDG
ncbi:MAG TPA: hypothetical protein VF462_15450 [Micromonosporaceae bacterium]